GRGTLNASQIIKASVAPEVTEPGSGIPNRHPCLPEVDNRKRITLNPLTEFTLRIKGLVKEPLHLPKLFDRCIVQVDIIGKIIHKANIKLRVGRWRHLREARSRLVPD